VANFYKNTPQSNFISNIAAFLNIDPGRLRIVGIRSGSSIVTAVASYDQSTDPAGQNQQLRSESQRLAAAISSQQVDLGATVLSSDVSYGVISEDGTLFSEESSTSSE